MTVPGIIDAHMHYFDVEGFRETALAAGHENSAACWRKICRENGIVFAVAMGNTMDEPSFYGGVPPRLINLAGPFDREHYNQPDDIGYCLGVMSEEIGEGQAEATAIDKALSDKAAEAQLYTDTIREYLSGVSDANGVNLLFMGRYPYRITNNS